MVVPRRRGRYQARMTRYYLSDVIMPVEMLTCDKLLMQIWVLRMVLLYPKPQKCVHVMVQ